MNILRTYNLIATVAILILFSACNSTKYLGEDELLLHSYKIEQKGSKVDSDGINELIRPQPNQKTLFFFNLKLWVHNLYNPEKLEARQEKKRIKHAAKNEKRLTKDKKEKEFKPTLGYRLRESVGEEPILFDSVRMKQNEMQISMYLKNKGYFHNQVEASYTAKKKKVKVLYRITPNKPHLIQNLKYSINDENLLQDLKQVTRGSLIKPGENFDMDVIDKERARISRGFRDLGYYFFNPEFIIFEADSNKTPFRIEIKEIIQNPKTTQKTENGSDSVVTLPHLKYTIRNVYINASYNPRFNDNYTDTVHQNGIVFINASQLNFNTRILAKSIFIKPGEKYSQASQEYTYRRINALKNFRFIGIRYEEISGSPGELNCTILLTPSNNQSFAAEAEGTNTGGNLGVSGNLRYTHKNIFRGTEQFSTRLRGGFEAQQTSNLGTINAENNIGIGDVALFNTLEGGIETSLNIPELMLPKKIYTFKLPRYENPKTMFNLGYNFQQRPDFTRTLSNASFAYYWSGTKRNSKDFFFYPLNVSLISIQKTPAFEQRLREINNPFFTNTYSDHLIVSSRFQYLWTNQNLRRNQNYTYNRFYVESAGNGLRALNELTDENKDIDRNFYSISGIRYAQFVRFSNDLRFNKVINKSSNIVYRFYGGVGFPYGNLDVLPFDRSFFVGGANDIRAWTARSLGPGSLPDSLKNGIDQVGDILLEFNVEYRFKVTKMLEGALFTDIGNIWLHERSNRPKEAQFELNRFYKEFAIGSGIGIRFDFSFLILRFDYGFQIHDPALAEGERWVFEPKTKHNAANIRNYRPRGTFNIGINYPF